ncbi:hypothetical protein F2A37_16530 [Pseudomonas chlororaphis]|uniref:hypothetical protein n=1 Tax=Pseudomonas chlororaphis TaxID=587753 RepID=UPI001231AAC5|nr:hypothetical protein [Pseudomonas chlororaphis]KAA5842273.1 hypothetical protein F2A37_16530 [Pseudomonas chlororaphis]
MTDYTELKRLAEDVNNSFPEKEDLWNMVCTPTVALGLIADLESLKAEIPGWTERELLLIAENERLRNLPTRNVLLRDREKLIDQRDELKAEIAGLRTGYEAYERVNAELKAENEALNSAIDHLERSRASSFEEYDFTRLKGRAGAQKVFEITIETECGCDIEEGEYTVRVTHLLGNWLGEDDFSLIEEAVAEVIADLNLPEEGHTTFIAFESGERQDVFWTKWFEIVTVASVLAEPDAAMSKGEQP